MKKEFVPYEESLALKELGFDEPCFAGYNFKDRRTGQFTYPSARDANTTSKARVYADDKKIVGAPLYQQAFRWFREKHNLTHMVSDNLEAFVFAVEGAKMFGKLYKTYEEAELACLKKLIEILNQNKDET